MYVYICICILRYLNEDVKTPVLPRRGNFIFSLFIKLLHTNSKVNGALNVQCEEVLHVYAWLTIRQIKI